MCLLLVLHPRGFDRHRFYIGWKSDVRRQLGIFACPHLHDFQTNEFVVVTHSRMQESTAMPLISTPIKDDIPHSYGINTVFVAIIPPMTIALWSTRQGHSHGG